MQRLVFFTDEHRPYQEPRAVSLTLQIMEQFQPHLVVIGSDACEFAALSNFPDRARYRGELKRTKESFLEGLREKRSAAPKARMYFLSGNHDQRLENTLSMTPELVELEEFQLQTWLELDKHRVAYSFDSDPFDRLVLSSRLTLTPNLLVLHGDYAYQDSGASAKAQLIKGERMTTSLLMGHCHRGGKFEIADRQGKPIGAYECYHHQRTNLLWLKGKNPNWMWGVVLVEYQSEPPYHFSVEQVNYIPVNGKLHARWRGREYVSK